VSAAKCKLLIADDEFWVRENIKSLLAAEKLPFSLLEPAEDGEDALRIMESERPDILITDINMPFLNGNELIKAAKKRFPQMPVIVLSGYNDFAFVREALLNGAIDYLLKPISKSALLDVLDKALSILNSSREMEREQSELREKLRVASSILRDGELSALIAEDAPDAVSGAGAPALELEFAVFTLLLIKLAELPLSSRRSTSDMSLLSFRVKDLLTKEARGGKAVAFHNVYSHDEFILLTDLDKAGIDRVCELVPEKLERFTGSCVSVAVSRPYYSFDRLRFAYQEAHSALMARTMRGGNAVVRAEDAQNLVVRKRLNSELEKRLLFALQSREKHLAGDIIFNQIGLRGCEGWLLIEVKQTAEYVASMIIQHGDTGASPRSTLSLENTAELLGMTLNRHDTSEVCSVIEQMLEEAFGESVSPGAGDSMRQTVRRVQEYIADNYFDDISLTSLSTLFRVERSYLSKAFKQVTGCNLMLSIAKKRMEKAAEYIRHRDLSLTEIGYLVGYEEYAYFNRVFHKIMGVSPSEFKARVFEEEGG
jgi:FixJ family two-component response regulator/AraC-like DNA-binding protein